MALLHGVNLVRMMMVGQGIRLKAVMTAGMMAGGANLITVAGMTEERMGMGEAKVPVLLGAENGMSNGRRKRTMTMTMTMTKVTRPMMTAGERKMAGAKAVVVGNPSPRTLHGPTQKEDLQEQSGKDRTSPGENHRQPGTKGIREQIVNWAGGKCGKGSIRCLMVLLE